jgi:hypothetical protein
LDLNTVLLPISTKYATKAMDLDSPDP